jgi:hypothetical protein
MITGAEVEDVIIMAVTGQLKPAQSKIGNKLDYSNLLWPSR